MNLEISSILGQSNRDLRSFVDGIDADSSFLDSFRDERDNRHNRREGKLLYDLFANTKGQRMLEIGPNLENVVDDDLEQQRANFITQLNVRRETRKRQGDKVVNQELTQAFGRLLQKANTDGTYTPVVQYFRKKYYIDDNDQVYTNPPRQPSPPKTAQQVLRRLAKADRSILRGGPALMGTENPNRNEFGLHPGWFNQIASADPVFYSSKDAIASSVFMYKGKIGVLASDPRKGFVFKSSMKSIIDKIGDPLLKKSPLMKYIDKYNKFIAAKQKIGSLLSKPETLLRKLARIYRPKTTAEAKANMLVRAVKNDATLFVPTQQNIARVQNRATERVQSRYAEYPAWKTQFASWVNTNILNRNNDDWRPAQPRIKADFDIPRLFADRRFNLNQTIEPVEDQFDLVPGLNL